MKKIVYATLISTSLLTVTASAGTYRYMDLLKEEEEKCSSKTFNMGSSAVFAYSHNDIKKKGKKVIQNRKYCILTGYRKLKNQDDDDDDLVMPGR